MISRKLALAMRPFHATIKKFPRLHIFAKRVKFQMWQMEVQRQADDKYVEDTLWVDPVAIEYMCILPDYDKYGDRGKVIGGDWDINRKKFADLDVYRAFEEHFVRGLSWRETDFYDRVLCELSKDTPKWGCKTVAQFNQRLLDLDSLYENIKTNGYKSQSEIAVNDPYKGEDEISVRIGRNGELLFEDGRHRLSTAKLLHINEVPVKVTVRHAEWAKFRKEILAYANAHGGRVYQPLLHPDLQAIPSHYGHERFEIINNSMPYDCGDLLDIGAHWGYFCQRFEEIGFHCWAIESDLKTVFFMQKLKTAQNRKFEIVNQSVFDYEGKMDFDVVLALNIFHHFLKNEHDYGRLIDFLQRLNVRTMFFQAHERNSAQMQNAYCNYNEGEFIDFILEHTGLSTSTYLGQTTDGRPIYRLDKSP